MESYTTINKKKDQQISIFVTDTEKKEVETRARSVGRSVSNFVRTKLFMEASAN